MDSAVLSILQADDRYTVTLETPRKGPMALAGTVWVGQEHRRDIIRIVDAVTDLINRQAGSESPYRGDVSRLAQVCEVGSLEEFGQLMYGLFLPPLIQNALRELDVALIISTNDCQIPWELLHDGQTFLGLRAPIARRLMVTRWVAGQESTVTSEPTFLIISNPLGDLPEADREADELMALLDARGIAYDLLRGPRATYIGVQQALVSGRYEVIHYTGHAFFDDEHPDRSGLHLAGDRNLPASQIEGILRGRPLVFLNACSSARQGDREANGWQVGYTGPQAEGLASAFISGGAAGFLGAQWPIFDAGSRDFAITFYHALLDGAATGEALQTARSRVRDRRPTDATWASFIFYGDPSLRIAETSAEMLARAESLYQGGQWEAALATLEQLARRGPSPEADALAEKIRAAQAEKARLAALYNEGIAAFERHEWQKAAEALSPVVAAEMGYDDAQPALMEARRQIEMANLLSSARQHLAHRRWRAAQEDLERLQSQDATYPGLADLLSQARTGLEADRQRSLPPPLMLSAGLVAVIVLAVFAILAIWRSFAGMTPALPTPTLSPSPTNLPSPTNIVVVYITPVPSPSATPTPLPTRPPGWSRVDNLGGAIVRSLAVDDQGATIYLGTWGGGVQRSTDGGQTWSAANNGLLNQHIWSIAIDPVTSSVLYVGSNGAGVFRSDDGGTTWVRSSTGIDSGYIYALAAVAQGGRTRLWAGTAQGRIFVSDDNARTWKPTAGQPAAGYINVFYVVPARPDRPGRVYVGTNVGVFLSTDNGATWKELPLRPGPGRPDIRDLVGDPRDEKIVYAGVAGEGVYRTRDGGASWVLTNQGMDNVRVRAMAVDPLDPQIVYVGTDGGRVYRSSNGGDRWESASAGLAGRSVQVLVILPFRLYAGTWGDGLFRSTDGGRNWTALQGNLNVLNAAAILGDPAARDGMLVGAYGKGIFYTDDGGRTWLPRQSGLSTEDIFSMVADPHTPTTVYALTGDGLFRSTDMGLRWQSINTGLSQDRPLALAIAPSDSSILYVSAGAGWIYRSQNQGERWIKTEERPTQAPVMALGVDPLNPSLVYAGSSTGLYRSTDGGQSWVKVQDAPIACLAIDPLSGDLFAGDNTGGVWRSSAGGLTWDPLGLDKMTIVTLSIAPRSADSKEPATIFAGTSSQGVFVSRDGGQSWLPFDNSGVAPFVQAISIHPAAPHDILVATSNGIYVHAPDK